MLGLVLCSPPISLPQSKGPPSWAPKLGGPARHDSGRKQAGNAWLPPEGARNRLVSYKAELIFKKAPGKPWSRSLPTRCVGEQPHPRRASALLRGGLAVCTSSWIERHGSARGRCPSTALAHKSFLRTHGEPGEATRNTKPRCLGDPSIPASADSGAVQGASE